MTQTEKLTKIIKFAEENGFIFQWDNVIPDNGAEYKTLPLFVEFHPEEIIFSHSFLKAFFGEQKLWSNDSTLISDPRLHDKLINMGLDFDWEHYAQKLVILPEEERIDYLYNFIKEKNEH